VTTKAGRKTSRGRGISRRTWSRYVAVVLSLLVFTSAMAHAQSQLVNEQNIKDGILKREPFKALERDALDVNRDGVLDVADLTDHLLQILNVLPSVSFAGYTSSIPEGDAMVPVTVLLNKAFASATTIHYTVGGTAAYGPKEQGGDYEIAGYDPATGGVITVNPGASEASILVSLHDDAVADEGIESIKFTLSADSEPLAFFMGVFQNHYIFVEDNDAVWQGGLEFEGGASFQGLLLEIIQDGNTFTGSVLPNKGVVPEPLGDDGVGASWPAKFYVLNDSLRVEIGPIPVAKELSLFGIPYSRYYLLEVEPGKTPYLFERERVMAGTVTETLEPVTQRLGPPSQEWRYMRRQSKGAFALLKKPLEPAIPEVPLYEND